MKWTLKKPELTGLWYYSEDPLHNTHLVDLGTDNKGNFVALDAFDREDMHYDKLTGYWSNEPISIPVGFVEGEEPKEIK